MLTRLAAKNFQSLAAVDLELGKLTVVVGHSNSGKSALVRALRVLAENAHSPNVVSAGKKTTVIAVEFDDGHEVVLERGRGVSKYMLSRYGATPEVYGKAGTSVPDEVEEVLRLSEVNGSLINFASQFDKPFLLDEPPTVVARTLGDLTNINVLHEAAREANRRRLAAAQKAKTRRQDLEHLTLKAREFLDLPDRLAALEVAKNLHAGLRQLAERHARLAGIIERMTMAQAALDSVVKPPDLSENLRRLDELLKRRARLRALMDAVDKMGAFLTRAEEAREAAAVRVAEAHREQHEALVDLGTCPLCGQSTRGVRSGSRG